MPRSVALFLVGLLVATGGCNQPLRVPRIEPVLASWPGAHGNIDGIAIHAFDTGGMKGVDGFLFSGGSWLETRRVVVAAFVIEHPTAGLIVFDTGLSPLAASDPDGYLGSLTAALGIVDAPPGADLPSQMRAVGLDPDDVSYVVISHLHYDHTGTAEDFVNAQVVVPASELRGAEEAGWGTDFFFEGDYDEVERWLKVDYAGTGQYATFIGHHDLLGDGSVVLVDLNGHTSGSQGMIVHMADRPILFTGDAAYVDESWLYAARPFMAHDMGMWWEQIWRIKKFAQLVPSAVIVPGHDLGVLDKPGGGLIKLHAFGGAGQSEAGGDDGSS
ncbi:MAG: N-acyl homoserine lactonase family protein [Deltaproteobacteria bacterium]